MQSFAAQARAFATSTGGRACIHALFHDPQDFEARALLDTSGRM
jgi:hypothetical protein